ncbi:PP2C family protein-serine/threonine phosphatase [Aeromicrobium fastidiosum]|uniref:Serine/threonine-protein phosphatase n=1 Tax=Aeromicrobium fastidiosum TaxID=52699 RepID=A0A641ATL0_9ACTN|nr:protein phosphatase 2C domain-containing protein [Aeromicrobium fastidiosum]KAA1380381.1 serine/threonine-protein phosphatase [Aeromicrobium fastidiosum]MBP2389951.1 protein phosphatase [Aeromicrobium fastidiosum]
MTALTYRYVALTDTGLRRADNEDSGYASDRLLVIADGMGGAAAGEIASSETLHVIRQLDQDLDIDAIDALDRAVIDANKRLADIIASDPSVEGMGTTLDALLWDGEKFAFAHIGDSRVYRLRGNDLQQLSTDHTFVQSLIDEGRISKAEARTHPHRSLILRAMLGRDDNGADLSWVQPVLGDRYLLCSDGLSDMVEDPAIARALSSETIDMAATELVRLALEGGGVDNVTVVIAEFVEKGTEPDEHLSSHDGQPQLVGAAASQQRPRTGGAASGTDTTRTESTFDPEELRYAPRPPSRRRWVRWTAGILVLAAILAGAGTLAYQWSQDQYYVSVEDGKVAVFRGVQADIPGVTLSHVDELTDIELSSLTEFQRREIEDGIEASSRADALRTIDELDVIPPTPDPAPTTPDPAPTTPAPTTPPATPDPAATTPTTATSAVWLR